MTCRESIFIKGWHFTGVLGEPAHFYNHPKQALCGTMMLPSDVAQGALAKCAKCAAAK